MLNDSTGWTHRALLTVGSRRLALLVMVASVFMPVTGLGIDLCPLHRVTGLPCPGCGLSRAIAAMSQGEPSIAVGLNPFVLLAWPLFVALALLAFAPGSVVAAVEAAMDRRGPSLTRGYQVVLLAFLGFGALRFAALLALGERFP
jgi:Protein of unknown function (DUF2752)